MMSTAWTNFSIENVENTLHSYISAVYSLISAVCGMYSVCRNFLSIHQSWRLSAFWGLFRLQLAVLQCVPCWCVMRKQSVSSQETNCFSRRNKQFPWQNDSRNCLQLPPPTPHPKKFPCWDFSWNNGRPRHSSFQNNTEKGPLTLKVPQTMYSRVLFKTVYTWHNKMCFSRLERKCRNV